MPPLIPRVLVSLAILCIVLVLAAIGGGVGYSSRTEFHITDASDDDLLVFVQDSAGTSWGNPDFISYSVYEAPYTVYVSGKLPSDSQFSRARIATTVLGDGVEVSSGTGTTVAVSSVAVHRANSVSTELAFGPVPVAVFEVLPKEVEVSGKVILSGADERIEKGFVKRFPAYRVQVFRVGPWMWERSTPPPNPSIERTSGA